MKDVSDSSSSDFDDIASEREEEQERSEQGRSSYVSRNNTVWTTNPPCTARTPTHNIIRQAPGLARGVSTVSPKDLFITREIMDEIISCRNIEG